MEERSGRPAKQVKVNPAAIDQIKVNVRKGQPHPPKPKAATTAHSSDEIKVNVRKGQPEIAKTTPANNPQTFADYVPPAMDDAGIDKAIDDIIVSESNEVLAAEDSINNSLDAKPRKKKKSRFKKVFKSKWLYIGLAVVIIGIFAWPHSRYTILGSFLKQNYKFVVVDSVTNTPVSGATIVADKQTASTNAYGQADLKLPLGKQKYLISKHFYATTAGNIFVGLSDRKADSLKLMATGRQVSITVINKLSGRLLAGVQISILNTKAITNLAGQASLVLPTKQTSYEGTISATGFNSQTTPIEVTTSSKANVVKLVPQGSVFFLSNATGTVNVIKANLDGSNPTIELAGTGRETAATKLIASPDSKYLLLEAERSGAQPELYVINTSTGNLTEFDSAPDNFSLIGWSGDMFIYDQVSSSLDPSTADREQLKSYNAITNQLNVLDENQVAGSSPSYGYQSFSNFELLPALVVYTTSWNSAGGYTLTTQNDTVRSVEPNGLNKKDYSTFQATTTGAINVVRNQPASLYVAVNNSSTNQVSYYNFINGALNMASISAVTMSASYPTYFISPSGESSLWNSPSGTANQIFIANQNGQNPKTLLVPAGFSAYGWYDNVYILLTKNNQLYIAPASGSNSPLFIGSYFS